MEILYFSYQNFQELDKDKDGFVTAEEILELQSSDIERLLTPGLLPEEESEEEEEEDNPLAKEEEVKTEESPIDKLVKSENERVGIKEEL